MAGHGVRVIGGEWRGRRLRVPGSARPTLDRAREAIFSALAGAIEGANVLDLYAGSGAFGIEALSRGAARAVFVDVDRVAIDTIRQNLEIVGATDRADVRLGAVDAYVRRTPGGPPFDLVFIDAPYATPAETLASVLGHLDDPAWLGPLATVVIERSARSEIPELPATWTVRWSRTYGDTLVTLASGPDV